MIKSYNNESFSQKHIIIAVYKSLSLIVSSSILLAFNSAMILAFCFFLSGIALRPTLLLASFCVTFSTYSLNKVTDKKEDAINRPELKKATGHYLNFSIVSMIVGLVIGLFEGPFVAIFLSIPLLIGLVYSIRIFKNKPRLKEITGVKNLVVALSWSLCGCLLSAEFDFNILTTSVIFIFIFTRIFTGSILCDVLDKKGDRASGIQTIPIKLGSHKTKRLLLTVNSLLLLLPLSCFLCGVLVSFLPVFVSGVFYGYLAIWWFYSRHCSRVTSGLMLDGEWLPMVILASLFIK